MRKRRFAQVDVFTAVPLKGNPVAVVLDGAAQGAGQQAMQPVRSGLKVGDEVAVGGIAALKGAWLGLGQEGTAP